MLKKIFLSKILILTCIFWISCKKNNINPQGKNQTSDTITPLALDSSYTLTDLAYGDDH